MDRTWRTAAAAVALAALTGCAVDRSADYATAGKGRTVAALMRAGDAERADGDYRAAATLYRSAYDADPDKGVTPLIRLGDALSAAGAPRDAADAYRRAIQAAPENADALRGLGNALVSLGQPGLALDYYERAHAAAPENWRVLLGRGAALDLRGEHAAARAAYDEGLEIAPGTPDLISNKGLSLALAGEHDAAIATLRGLLGAPDTAARHRQTLAMIYGLAGQDEKARDIAAMDLPPAAVTRNLAFYRTLRGLPDSKRRLRAIRARTFQ